MSTPKETVREIQDEAKATMDRWIVAAPPYVREALATLLLVADMEGQATGRKQALDMTISLFDIAIAKCGVSETPEAAAYEAAKVRLYKAACEKAKS